MTHNFKEALEYMDGKHYNPTDMSVAFYDEIRLALKLADRLTAEPSGAVLAKIAHEYGHAGHMFKAMRDQLIKEIEND